MAGISPPLSSCHSQQHLCSVTSPINIKGELLKPELLVGMLAKPLIVPADIKHGRQGESQYTQWQTSELQP